MKFSGSTSCAVVGSADECKMTITGSGDFKGYNFIVNNLTCTVFGSSGVQVTCNDELNIKTFGSSDVYYRGTVKKINKRTAGSSNIIQVDI